MKRWIAGWWLCCWLASAAAPDDPSLLATGIVNAADRTGGPVCPGEIVILYIANAGPATLVGQHLDEAGKVATTAGETRVLFDGIAAPLAYTVTGEVAAVVPYEIAGRRSTEVVVEYQGRRSAAVTLPVVGSTPALFTLDGSGSGQAAILNATGCCNSARNPAEPGTVVALYATGEGQTAPGGITGNVSSYPRPADYPTPALPVTVTVGGKTAEIIFAGEAPHTVAGLLQVNFRIPADAPASDAAPLVLTVGGARSPETVTMAIRSKVQRVLVSEPDPETRAWFRRVLTGAGYEVTTARGAGPADMVIADVALPERERMETIGALRAERPHLRVAAIVGTAGPESLRAADLMGAQAVFARPLRSAEVLRRVKELLRTHTAPYVTEDIPERQRMLIGGPR